MSLVRKLCHSERVIINCSVLMRETIEYKKAELARSKSALFEIGLILSLKRSKHLLGHDDSVDDVDDAVAALDVGRDDIGSVDGDRSIFDNDLDLLAVYRFG